MTFSTSQLTPGVLAYARILSNIEVIIVANTTGQNETLAIIVDETINAPGDTYRVLYSNKPAFTIPGAAQDSGQNTIVYDVGGIVDHGPVRYITVTLQPLEAQILGSPRG